MTVRTTRSKCLPRYERSPKRAPKMRLTDRDRAVLYDLYWFRHLPASLICERQFGSLSRARTRLRLLFHHGFVDRHVLPSVGTGSGEAIYGLGPAAVPELVTHYGLAPEDIRKRRKRVEPLFLAHHLLVATFRSRLGFAGAPAGIGIYDWREGEEARLKVTRRDRRTGELVAESVTPDGIAWLKSRKARFAFCLEADRGTMSLPRMRRKFERYEAVAQQGVLKDSFGADRFRVLVVAPTDRRLASIKKAAEAAGARNVWLTTAASLGPDIALGAVWERAGHPGRFTLFRDEQVFDNLRTPHGLRRDLPPQPNDKPQRRNAP